MRELRAATMNLMLLAFAIFTVDFGLSASTSNAISQSPSGENSLAHILDVGRPAVMVRRGKHSAQGRGFADPTEKREVAVNGDSSIQSFNERDTSLNVDSRAAVLTRRENHGKHIAESRGFVDLMRGGAVVAATGDISMALGNFTLAVEEAPMWTLPFSTRPEVPENVSAKRPLMLYGLETPFHGSSAPSRTSPKRKHTPRQVLSQDIKRRYPHAAQSAPPQEKSSDIAHSIRELNADPNTMSTSNALAHASVTANVASPSQSMATTQALATVAARGSDEAPATAAPVVRVKRAGGLGIELGAALFAVPSSAVQSPVTTTAPTLTTAAVVPVGGGETTAAPVESEAEQGSLLWSLVKVICAIALCILVVIFGKSWLNRHPQFFRSNQSSQQAPMSSQASSNQRGPQNFRQTLSSAGSAAAGRLTGRFDKMMGN